MYRADQERIDNPVGFEEDLDFLLSIYKQELTLQDVSSRAHKSSAVIEMRQKFIKRYKPESK